MDRFNNLERIIFQIQSKKKLVLVLNALFIKAGEGEWEVSFSKGDKEKCALTPPHPKKKKSFFSKKNKGRKQKIDILCPFLRTFFLGGGGQHMGGQAVLDEGGQYMYNKKDQM